MPSPRATSEPKKSMISALVIFVVLFLAAAVLAVVLFMNNEQLVKDKNDAVNALDEIANNSQRNALKPMIERSGSRVTPAMSRVIQDMREMAQLIGGRDIGEFDLVGVRDLVTRRFEPLWPRLKGVFADPALAEPAVGLATIVQNLLKQNEELLDKVNQAEINSEAQREQKERAIQTKDEDIARLGQELAVQTQAARANAESYSKLANEQTNRYEEIIRKRDEEIAKMQEELKQIGQEKDRLTTEIAKYQVTVKQLNDRLQQFQPKPETEMAALEPDGEVISMVSREKLAYINLNQNDHIYRGLTFTVYDRYQPIPKTGQGKGSLEVIEIMDNISKCRITHFDPTNPIMEKDIIANLVWSRDKKYNFCVIGDFDFNSDGLPDPDGRQRIIELIEHWGGVVTVVFSVDTDFLVVGNPPQLPPRPADEYIDTDAAVARQYRQAQQLVRDYDAIRAEGAALGVPTFNLSRFLYFIGFYTQAKNLPSPTLQVPNDLLEKARN